MRAKDATEKELAAEQEATTKVAERKQSDEWETMKSIFIPRGYAGQQKFVMVGVNGRKYQVPRGKQVEVPLPLYERLMIMMDGEAKAQNYMESIPNEAAPESGIKRM